MTHRIQLSELLLFVFRPSEFARRAALLHEGVRRDGEGSKSFASALDQELDRISVLRRSFCITSGLVFSVAALAWISARIFSANFGTPPQIVNYAQAIGSLLLLVGTLWQLDLGVRTFGGKTLSEQAHSLIFRMLSALGTFLFLFAYFLP